MDIQEEKALLRRRIEERMERMTAQERAAESRSIERRILEHLPPEVQTICAYYPLRTEADLRELLRELLRRGLHLYLPRFAGNLLTFHAATDLDHLVPGALRIPEPPPDAPSIAPACLDLALVPGRAFDRDCWRLGRGNGGYDVWIRSQRVANPNTRFWGIALECQIARSIPHERHDAKVDTVFTARGPLDSPLPGREGWNEGSTARSCIEA